MSDLASRSSGEPSAIPEEPSIPPADHELKVWPEFFTALSDGRKTFEFRRDDRTPRYQVGDVLRLREFIVSDCDHIRYRCEEIGCEGDHYTGLECLRRVTYVARGGLIPQGFCIMSVERLSGGIPRSLSEEPFGVLGQCMHFADDVQCDRAAKNGRGTPQVVLKYCDEHVRVFDDRHRAALDRFAPSSERAVSEEERTAILDAARMLYAVDGEVTAAEEKGSTSEFDREDFYGALSIAEELQTLAARLDGSTKDMVDMHKWPDGQVREEEPYRCGVFIAATGQQCLGLSDHEGNCWFDPVARPAPSLPVMPPAISGDALLKYTLDFHAAVEALPASETQSLLTMMCGAADKLAHEFEFSAIWIGPIHKGVREILRVRAELDASRERQKNA